MKIEIKKYNKQKGNLGEKIAQKYLETCNYDIICTNFSSNRGEIDIIAKEDDEYVFIEVKTRINREYGFASESVSTLKQLHIKNTAKYFLYKNDLLNKKIRFDIIEVYLKRKSYMLNHIKSVFW